MSLDPSQTLRQSKQHGVRIPAAVLWWGIDIAVDACFLRLKEIIRRGRWEDHSLPVTAWGTGEAGVIHKFKRGLRVAKGPAGIEHMFLHMHQWMHRCLCEHKGEAQVWVMYSLLKQHHAYTSEIQSLTWKVKEDIDNFFSHIACAVIGHKNITRRFPKPHFLRSSVCHQANGEGSIYSTKEAHLPHPNQKLGFFFPGGYLWKLYPANERPLLVRGKQRGSATVNRSERMNLYVMDNVWITPLLHYFFPLVVNHEKTQPWKLAKAAKEDKNTVVREINKNKTNSTSWDK